MLTGSPKTDSGYPLELIRSSESQLYQAFSLQSLAVFRLVSLIVGVCFYARSFSPTPYRKKKSSSKKATANDERLAARDAVVAATPLLSSVLMPAFKEVRKGINYWVIYCLDFPSYASFLIINNCRISVPSLCACPVPISLTGGYGAADGRGGSAGSG